MSSIDRGYFHRAFDLAYFIHPNQDIALRITEAAVCKLEVTLGKQGRRLNYAAADDPRTQKTFQRKTRVALKEEHLLQALVYVESDTWERSSEHGLTQYTVTESDLVIRFVKYLVQITIKRNSFYVTLGLGRLLYDYGTSQVRQMYDVLMQDQARFRDNSYLRKQKKVLMREITRRFGQMIQIVKTDQGEDRFMSQPITGALIELVGAALIRFTPWDTACVIPDKFDPVGTLTVFQLSGTDADESVIETNRIHAIIDPDCFSRLVTNLGFALPDNRLAVPQFFYSDRNLPHGDRLNPPTLTDEQYDRLEQARQDRARRRRNYRVGQLRIYVDDVEVAHFDPRRKRNVELRIPGTATSLEVRGADNGGELPLATLLVPLNDFGRHESFKESLTLEAGQRIAIALTPKDTSTDNAQEILVRIKYTETEPIRAIAFSIQRARLRLLLTQQYGRSEQLKDYRWLIAGVAVVLLAVTATLILWPLSRSSPIPEQVVLTPMPTRQLVSSPTPTPESDHPRHTVAPTNQVARVVWNTNPRTVDNAFRVEVRRGGESTIEISGAPPSVPIAMNQADPEGAPYIRYRMKLTLDDTTLWQEVLSTPKPLRRGHAYVVNFKIFPSRLPKASSYTLEIEGEVSNGWQPLGKIFLKPVSR